jgi:DNA-binding transcriptional regulator GbsR (MarR family)
LVCQSQQNFRLEATVSSINLEQIKLKVGLLAVCPPSAPTLTAADPAFSSRVALAAPSAAPLTPFEHAVIDIFVGLADVLGIPKSVGEIYGLLYASVRPLAFQDIVERLEISKGSASQGLRLLRTVGAIKLVYVAGDRRDHFLPETELRALLTGFLREKVQPHLESGGLRVKSLQALALASDLGAGSAKELRLLRDRIDKLNAWQRKGKSIVPLITKFFR